MKEPMHIHQTLNKKIVNYICNVASLLYKYSIHRDLISLISVCKNPNNHRYNKMRPMQKISRNNILVYCDQMAMDKKFDIFNI